MSQSTTEEKSTILLFDANIDTADVNKEETPSEIKKNTKGRRSSILPELPSIDTLLDYVSVRTLTYY